MYGFLKDHRQAWAREEIGAAVGSGQAPLTRALLFKQLHSYLSRDDPEGSAAVGGGGALDRLDIPPNTRTNTCAPSSFESVSPSCMINNLPIKLPVKTTEPECRTQSQLDVGVTRMLSCSKCGKFLKESGCCIYLRPMSVALRSDTAMSSSDCGE